MPLIKRSSATSEPDTKLSSRTELATSLHEGASQAERRNAARDLAAQFGADQELAAALPRESDPGVRAAILAALVSIGTERAASFLAVAAKTEDAQHRNAAIDALRHMGALVLPHAERLMASSHPEPRIRAILLVETLNHPRALALLRAALEDDPDLNVGLAAVEALSQNGGPEHAPWLRAFAARFPHSAFAGFAVALACRRATAGASA